MIKTVTYTLPTYWASSLVNDDPTGLTDEDERSIEDFFADNPNLHCVDISEDYEFARWHDATPYGVPACEVSQYTFQVLDQE